VNTNKTIPLKMEAYINSCWKRIYNNKTRYILYRLIHRASNKAPCVGSASLKGIP